MCRLTRPAADLCSAIHGWRSFAARNFRRTTSVESAGQCDAAQPDRADAAAELWRIAVKVSAFELMPYRDLPADFTQRYESAWVTLPWKQVADAELVGKYYNWTL